MNMTDPIADMLTRIRNATLAKYDQVLVPYSRLKLSMVKILKEEGFIKDWEVVREDSRQAIKISLRYVDKNQPALTGLKRVSKPGLRVYANHKDMPRVLGGLGVAIVSTPLGLMTDRKARKSNLGGEVLCYVW